MTPTKRINPLSNNKPKAEWAKSLNFDINFLKDIGVTSVIYDGLKPILGSLDNLNENSPMFELNEIGISVQFNIGLISNKVLGLNNITSFSKSLIEYKEIVDKENKLFFFGKKTDRIQILEEIAMKVSSLKENLSKSKSDLETLMFRLELYIQELSVYNSLFALFREEIIKREIMSLEQLSNHDTFTKRTVSLSNSLVVANQLKQTIEITKSSIKKELDLCDVCLNTTIPSFTSLKMLDRKQFDSKIDEWLRSL